MSYLYKRENHDGSRTFYYSGAGEVAAIVVQEQGLWVRHMHQTQISVAKPAEPFATRAGAESAAEIGFDVITKL
jgi:hypothetical protein